MGPLDLLVVLVILLGVLLGYRSGILSQALGLAGAATAVGLIILVGPFVGPALAGYEQPLRAVLAVGGAAFLVVTGDALGSTLGGLLHERVSGTLAAPVDRVGGALFGLCQGVVICWLIGGLIATGPFPTLAAQAQRSVAMQTILGALPPPGQVIGELGGLLDQSGLPDVFVGLEPLPAAPVQAPDAAQANAIARLAEGSTVRIESAACQKLLVGTGFMIRPGYLVTNAHVIAGARTTTVSPDLSGGRYPASPVFFDAELDVALLYVPGLSLPPLRFAGAVPQRGTVGAALGHPDGAPLTVIPSAVTADILARGRDLYGESLVTRQVLELQAAIRPGDSGGPLVLADGTVGGLVFADSRTDPNVGYALDPTAVYGDVAPALTATSRVSTGPCVP